MRSSLSGVAQRSSTERGGLLATQQAFFLLGAFFFLSVVPWFASMGIGLSGPGGAAAARNGFACAVPGLDTGYSLQERLTSSRHTVRATTATTPAVAVLSTG